MGIGMFAHFLLMHCLLKSQNLTSISIGEQLTTEHRAQLMGASIWQIHISKELDFTLSYTANYNFVFNSILPEQNNNYLTQLSTLKINWLPWKGLVLTSDLTNSTYSGLTATFNLQIWLWNAGI